MPPSNCMGCVTIGGSSTSRPRNIRPIATDGINGVENADLSLPSLLALSGASSATPTVHINIVTTAVITDM